MHIPSVMLQLSQLMTRHLSGVMGACVALGQVGFIPNLIMLLKPSALFLPDACHAKADVLSWHGSVVMLICSVQSCPGIAWSYNS